MKKRCLLCLVLGMICCGIITLTIFLINQSDLIDNSPSGKINSIAYIGLSQEFEFWNNISVNLKEEAFINDIEIIDLTPERKDGTRETEAQELIDLIEYGIDGIIIGHYRGGAMKKALDKAEEKDIPVLAIDSGDHHPGIISFLRTDNVKGGESLGLYLVPKIPSSSTVLILSGDMQDSSARDRLEGMSDTLKKAGINYIVRETKWDNATTKEILKEILPSESYNISAIMCPADYIAEATYELLKEMNLKENYIITGFDGLLPALNLIKEEKIAATYMQPIQGFPERAIKLISMAKQKLPIKTSILVPGELVTSKNVEEFMKN